MVNTAEVETLPVAQQETLPAPMHDIIKAIAEKGDTTALKEVMEMQRQMIAHGEERTHARAIAAFQQNIPVIQHNRKVMNKDGQSVRYTYADLDTIMAAIRSDLGAHGLSVTYDGEMKDAEFAATCYVRCGGAVTQATFKAPIDPDAYMTDQQKTASATSFAMRYAVIMALGLTSTGMVDDDGRSADRPAGDKLLAHNQCVRDHFYSVYQIKESLVTDDYETAAQAMSELDREVQLILWLAPSKGGIFSTEDREKMKSNEWAAAIKLYAAGNEKQS